jgi:hypothetical protein
MEDYCRPLMIIMVQDPGAGLRLVHCAALAVAVAGKGNVGTN